MFETFLLIVLRRSIDHETIRLILLFLWRDNACLNRLPPAERAELDRQLKYKVLMPDWLTLVSMSLSLARLFVMLGRRMDFLFAYVWTFVVSCAMPLRLSNVFEWHPTTFLYKFFAVVCLDVFWWYLYGENYVDHPDEHAYSYGFSKIISTCVICNKRNLSLGWRLWIIWVWLFMMANYKYPSKK